MSPQFHFIADQWFETFMGGLSPSLKLDLPDPEAIRTFLKTRWDTDDRDHALDHWDPEIDESDAMIASRMGTTSNQRTRYSRVSQSSRTTSFTSLSLL
jgi:hypothetical protein